MGTSVAANISPPAEFGVGSYDRDDLAGVLRRGVSPKRRLYPAMTSLGFAGTSGHTGDVALQAPRAGRRVLILGAGIAGTRIAQSETGVTVTYEDGGRGGPLREETADWCICTIPLSVLVQLDVECSDPMRKAIAAVPYLCLGLQGGAGIPADVLGTG